MTRTHRVLFVAALLVVFLPRLLDLDVFIGVDGCMHWLSRSADFCAALSRLDFLETCRCKHPGVTVMALSGAFLALGSLLEFGTVEVYRHLEELLFFAKLPLAVLTGTGLVAIWWVLRKTCKSERLALTTLAFLALDPLLLAHSRYLQLDATNTIFMLLCLVTGAAATRNDDRRYLVASGAFCGLALLTRSSSLALVPYVCGILFLKAQRQASLRSCAARCGLWCGIAALVFVALWPAMWVAPVRTLGIYAGAVSKAFEQEHDIRGTPRLPEADPDHERFSARFFEDFVVYRSSAGLALMIVGGVLLARRLLRREGGPGEQVVLYLCGFGAFFLVGMSFFAKATTIDIGYRYVLTTFAAFQMLAAYGFDSLLGTLRQARRPYPVLTRIGIAMLMVTLTSEGYRVLRLHPYYQSFHNELFPPTYFGWGEGMELVAGYLNEKPDAERLVVAADFTCCLGYFLRGEVIPLREVDTAARLDYVVLYNSQVNRGLFPDLTREYMDDQTHPPEFVARINDIDYAWLYRSKRP